MDRNLPISEVLTMEHVVSEATAQPRFLTLLLGTFAAIALLLAAIGIFGVMSYAVARRTHEIGIRISLGATGAQVLRMVMRQGLTHALAGCIVGMAGALLLGRTMNHMLYGVKPEDPLTLAVTGGVLTAAAILAICLPAARAIRIEPVAALRQD